MAAKLDPKAFVFRGLRGQKLIKLPGEINGNGFVLDSLYDCEVYLLDHSSQVQVDDCVGCKIFIGPCDGSVFIRDCSGCQLNVAARQLRTRDCKDLDLSLYCATQPSIETSHGLRFSCWRGAYPGLGAHFSAAKLDPHHNTWSQVFDFNKEGLPGLPPGTPHYELLQGAHPDGWWLSPSAAEGGPPGEHENPVPADGGPAFAAAAAGEQATSAAATPLPAATVEARATGPAPAAAQPGPGRTWDDEVALDDEEEVVGGGAAVAAASPAPAAAAAANGNGSGSADWFMAPAPKAATPAVAPPAAAEVDARLAWRAANNAVLLGKSQSEAAAKQKAREEATKRLAQLRQAAVKASQTNRGINRQASQEAAKLLQAAIEAAAAAGSGKGSGGPTNTSTWQLVSELAGVPGQAGRLASSGLRRAKDVDRLGSLLTTLAGGGPQVA